MSGRKVLDLTGQKFGWLTAIKPVARDAKGHTRWLVQCKCNKEFITRTSNLTSGQTRSCGCSLRRENRKAFEEVTFK